MRKSIIVSAAIATLLVAAAGSLTMFIYTRNFGTDYKGRARLDYNWKYYFTACPKDEYRYDGKYFSFSYPKFEKENTLREVIDVNGVTVIDNYYRLYIEWQEKDEKNIKPELSRYLSSPDGEVTPSMDFMRWLVGSGPKVSVYAEKIKLKGGSSAVIMSGRGKEQGYMPGLVADQGQRYIYLIGLTPSGHIINLKNAVTRAFAHQSRE